MLRLVRPVVLTALALLPAPARQASPEAETEAARAAFYGVLDRSARMMGMGRWEQARGELIAALAEHGDADYVLVALPGVREDLQRCAFWSAYERPEPADVVVGELLSWNHRKGDIKLRYSLDRRERKELFARRRGTRALPFESDFEEDEDFFAHPLVFDGPHSIEVRCGPLGKRSPRVIVCADDDVAYLALLGTPSGILRIEGGSSEVEDSSLSPVPTDEPLRVKVDVGARRITLSVNGKVWAKCDKDRDHWGQLGFFDFPNVAEITIEGDAETAWIEYLLDSAVQTARAEFDEGYDPEGDLPEVLRGRIVEETEQDFLDTFPVEETPALKKQIEKVLELMREGSFDDALLYVDSLAEVDGQAALWTWFRALLHAWTGSSSDVLAELDRLAGMEPGFWPAREQAALVRSETRPRRSSLDDALALVEEFPDEPRAREWLATCYLSLAMSDEAQAVLDRARTDGLSSAGLDGRRRVLAKAVRGPVWTKPFEHRTTHYVISSDMGKDVCQEAGKLLEDMYRKLDVRFWRIDPDKEKERFRVFLFSGPGGYMSYASEVFDSAAPERTLGMYSPVMKQLLIWNLPDREEMMNTIRHEGFHQVFDQVVDYAPRWLHEGLATYFERSRRVGGKWQDGVVPPGRYRVLTRRPLLPLAEFLPMTPQRFYADSDLGYAQGWALVHFLLESGPAERERFDALIDGLIAGEESNALLARLFPAAELPELDRRLKAHVESLAGE